MNAKNLLAALSAPALALTLAVALSPAAALAADPAEGPVDMIFDNGDTTYVPAAQVDESSYLAQGFVKNTAADGTVILERIPGTDVRANPYAGEYHWDIAERCK